MNAEDTGTSPKVPRRTWGRRKVDWMVPLILLILSVMAGLWAIDNYSKAQQLKQINMALDAQSKLLDRLLEKGDEKRGERAPDSVPPPAGTVTEKSTTREKSSTPESSPAPAKSPVSTAKPATQAKPASPLSSAPVSPPAAIIENTTPDNSATRQ